MLANVAVGVGQSVPVALSLKHTAYWLSAKSVCVTVATVKSLEDLGITDNVLTTTVSVTGDPTVHVAF